MSNEYKNVELTRLEKILISEVMTLSEKVNKMNDLLIKANGYGIYVHDRDKFYRDLNLKDNRGVYSLKFLSKKKFNERFIVGENGSIIHKNGKPFHHYKLNEVESNFNREFKAYIIESASGDDTVLLLNGDGFYWQYPITFFDEDTIHNTAAIETDTYTELKILTSRNYE